VSRRGDNCLHSHQLQVPQITYYKHLLLWHDHSDSLCCIHNCIACRCVVPTICGFTLEIGTVRPALAEPFSESLHEQPVASLSTHHTSCDSSIPGFVVHLLALRHIVLLACLLHTSHMCLCTFCVHPPAMMHAGGVKYPGVPFNGWFMNTEIGRDLMDPYRYDKVRTQSCALEYS
jgi:Nitric oxide synthase, oxygenase domain